MLIPAAVTALNALRQQPKVTGEAEEVEGVMKAATAHSHLTVSKHHASLAKLQVWAKSARQVGTM